MHASYIEGDRNSYKVMSNEREQVMRDCAGMGNGWNLVRV